MAHVIAQTLKDVPPQRWVYVAGELYLAKVPYAVRLMIVAQGPDVFEKRARRTHLGALPVSHEGYRQIFETIKAGTLQEGQSPH